MSLPKPGEPLVLADGTQIDPTTGSPVTRQRRVEVPRHSEAQELVTSTRMKLRDLPAKPEEGLNTLSVIVMYSLIGLDDAEIAVALKCDVRQVSNIRMSDTFGELQTMFMKSIVERDAEGVRTRIAQASTQAVATMISLMKSDSDQIALAASKDILDRDGHRPVDVVEHRHSMEGGLTITYIEKRDGDDVIPDLEGAIDAEYVRETSPDDGSSSA